MACGITIIELINKELCEDPCVPEDLALRRSFIQCPQLKSTQGLPKEAVNCILTTGEKEQIFELFTDRILTPPGYRGIEFLNFFEKAEWSTAPLETGQKSKSYCFLALLSTSCQLVVYGKLKDTVANGKPEEWKPLVDISQLYNDIIQEQWVQNSVTSFGSIKFYEYKELLYEISCVDFTWMTSFGSGDESYSTESYIITAQANGDIIIWLLQLQTNSYLENPVLGKPMEKKNVCNDDIISVMKFHKVNDHMGVLAIGTSKGAVKLFKILTGLEETTDMPFNQTFSITDGVHVIGQDLLKIDFLEWVLPPVESSNILKSPTLNLVVVKHCNYIFAADIIIISEEIVVNSVHNFQIPVGPIVGIDKYTEDHFIVHHEAGIFTIIQVQNGIIKYYQESVHIFSTSSGITSDLYIYSGLAFSPNKSLACVGKQLNCQFHPVTIKEPAKLIIFSTLAGKDSWELVKASYAAKDYCFRNIVDVLVAFRFHLRSPNIAEDDYFKDDQILSQMNVEQLRLLLWVIKCFRFDNKKYFTDENLKEKKINRVLLRRLEIENHIMMHHFTFLIANINKHRNLPKFELSQKNLNSLYMIQTYLRSKPDIPKLPKWAMTRPVIEAIPLCPYCSSHICFDREDSSCVLEDHSHSWDFVSCSERHRFQICMLSLLPITIPYRYCPTCKATASLEPAFEQEPVCPFCKNYMLPNGISPNLEIEKEEVMKFLAKRLKKNLKT